MTTENVTVIAIYGDRALVAAKRAHSCLGCSSKMHCTSGVIAQLFSARCYRFYLNLTVPAKLGDKLSVTITDAKLLQASFCAYLLPLSFFTLTAIISCWLITDNELINIANAFAGGWFGYMLSRKFCNATAMKLQIVDWQSKK